MDVLVVALAPAFAAGFAVQRLLELIDPVFGDSETIKNKKKIILGIISIVIGFVLAIWLKLRVLAPLGIDSSETMDIVVTAFIVSAGTEGFNSIMKFLGYAKEDKKAAAAESQKNADPDALREISRLV